MLTIYKASAGSGKTFTLAYEYLKKLLGVKERGADYYHLNADKYTPSGHRRPNRHRGILAITFTNAATEEMKTRIVRELASLAQEPGDDSLYARWLVRDFGCTAQELRQAAAQALAEMLYDYGNFNVSTIDSFFQTVLRTFSREIDHQGDYELSLDVRDTVKQSISLLLDDLNYSKPRNARRLFDWISRYTLGRMSQGKGYNFFHRDGSILNSLADDMTHSMDETYSRHATALRQYLEDPARVEAFSRELRKKADEAIAPARATAAELIDRIESRALPEKIFNGTILTRARQLHRGLKLDDVTGATITKAATGVTPPEKLAVAKQCKDEGIKPADIAEELGLMARFCAEIQHGVPLRDFYLAIDDSLGLLDFYGMAAQKLEEYLRESNTVLISDTGDLLRRIISDAEMPFIYERLGMRLTNLLIDEFQDTSHLQWHNLRPLVANSIAEGHDNLIIGDEKQAIYRFRNSDSALLGSIVQTRDFPADHSLRGFDSADNTNHRSAGDVVRVNNTIFSRMAAAMDVSSYSNVIQTPCDRLSAQPAYVRMQFYTKDTLPADNDILEEMAQDILDQHSRGYRWRDILVLVRRGKEAAAAVEYLTSRHPEIAVLSSEALLLSSSPAVRAIMSMLKLVESSFTSNVSAGAAAEGAPKYASHSDIVMMITRFNYHRAEGLDAADSLRLALDDSGHAATRLDDEIRAIRAENPANLVALIDAIILHKVTPAQRREEYAYIAALQDLAVKHTESANPSLAAFIAAYERNVDKWAIKASADTDAVEVMTIHKSKGLERACVHIPFGDWELVHDSQSLWLPMDLLEGFDPAMLPPVLRLTASTKSPLRDARVSPFAALFEKADKDDLTDSLNICYVAFTRAARELMVHSATDKIGKAVMAAVSAQATSDETGNTSLCDTAAHFDAGTLLFELGNPTSPGAPKPGRPSIAAGEYPVLFRDDTRRLTSIDDAFATHLDIGGEDDKYIVDRPPFDPESRMAQAARTGNDLHSILASVRTADDLERAVTRHATRTGLSDAERKTYLDELRAAIEAGGETVAAWFDPVCRVYAERSIYLADKGISFRPDRVVITPDGVTQVVDYKFTTEPRPEHFKQVENYIRLMRRLGRDKVCGYLWYPLLKKTIPVTI